MSYQGALNGIGERLLLGMHFFFLASDTTIVIHTYTCRLQTGHVVLFTIVNYLVTSNVSKVFREHVQ